VLVEPLGGDLPGLLGQLVAFLARYRLRGMDDRALFQHLADRDAFLVLALVVDADTKPASGAVEGVSVVERRLVEDGSAFAPLVVHEV